MTEVIIYDDYYLKLDNQIYGFKYDRLMYYQLSLNLLGKEHRPTLTILKKLSVSHAGQLQFQILT